MMTFTIAVIIGVTAVAVAQDFHCFAEGSPESFLRTWRCRRPGLATLPSHIR